MKRFIPALAAMAMLTIWACSDNGTGVDPIVSGPMQITVTPDTVEVEAGESIQLSATVVDLSNNREVTDPALTWTSDNGAVATVNGNGLVTGVSDGAATITVRFGEVRADARVTVLPADDTGTAAPPVAAFSIVSAGAAGEASAFDGTASTDPQDETLTYRWDFDDGSSGGSAVMGHIFAAAGSYAVTLTVTNESGLSDQTTESISVASGPTPSATNGVVTGLVMNAAGNPLGNATVAVVGGGPSGTTNGDGAFTVTGVAVGVPVIFSVSRAGHAVKRQRVEIPAGTTDGYFEARLLSRQSAGTLTDAEQGGAVTGLNGTRIVLGENALVDGDGNPVTGSVDVSLTPVDVASDEIDAFPGVFDGILPDGQSSLILSFGAAEFILEQGGARLNLAPGSRAEIEIPVYTGGAAIGEEIELWSLDPNSGIWIQEGVGVVVSSGSETGLSMRAEIGHLSWWNIDKPSQRITANGRSRGPQGNAWGFHYRARSVNADRAVWGGSGSVPPEGLPIILPIGFDVQVRGRSVDQALAFDTTVTSAMVNTGDLEFLLREAEPWVPSAVIDRGLMVVGDTVSGQLTDPGIGHSYAIEPGPGGQIMVQYSATSGLEGTIVVIGPDNGIVKLVPFSPISRGKLLLSGLQQGEHRIEFHPFEEITGDYVLYTHPVLPIEMNANNASPGAGAWIYHSFDAEAGTIIRAMAWRLGISRVAPQFWRVYLADGALIGGNHTVDAVDGPGVVLPSTSRYVLEIQSNFVDDFMLGLSEVVPVALPTAAGEAAGHVDALDVWGQMRVYSFEAEPGTGLVVSVVGDGGEPLATSRVYLARIGSGNTGAPADRNRTDVFQYDSNANSGALLGDDLVLAGAAARLDAGGTDTYLIGVRGFGNEGNAAVENIGTFKVRVDQVAPSSQITVSETLSCAGATTRSLHAALLAVAPGGQLSACAGTYEGPTSLRIVSQGVTLTGTSRDDVVLRHHFRPRVGGQIGYVPTMLVGALGATIERLTVESHGGGIWTEEVRTDGLRIEDVTIRNLLTPGRSSHGIQVRIDSETRESSSDIVIRGTSIDISGPFGATGIAVRATGGVVVEDNDISASTSGTTSSISRGIQMFTAGGVIRNNAVVVATGSQNRGIEVGGGLQGGDTGDGKTLVGNTVRLESGGGYGIWAHMSSEQGATVIRENEVDIPGTFDATGMWLQVREGRELRVQRNRVSFLGTGATQRGIRLEGSTSASGTARLENNVIDGATLGVRIRYPYSFDQVILYHNSFGAASNMTSTSFPSVLLETSSITSGPAPIRLVNNIFQGRADRPDVGIQLWADATVEENYNLFADLQPFLGGSSSLAGVEDYGANSITAEDPGYADSMLQLAPNSPAIDAGARQSDFADLPDHDYEGNPRPVGAGPDMGAYERAGGQ